MLISMRPALAGALLAASVLAVPAAQAATCSITETVVTKVKGVDVSSQLTTDYTVSAADACYAYGDGNINGEVGKDPILAGKNQQNGNGKINTITPVSGLITGLEFLSDFGGTKSATVNIADSIFAMYDNLVLAYKTGNHYVSFLVSKDVDFTLVVDPKESNGVSHVNLYGLKKDAPPPAVPLPAAGILLLGGLGGLGLMKRRRKA